LEYAALAHNLGTLRSAPQRNCFIQPARFGKRFRTPGAIRAVSRDAASALSDGTPRFSPLRTHAGIQTSRKGIRALPGSAIRIEALCRGGGEKIRQAELLTWHSVARSSLPAAG